MHLLNPSHLDLEARSSRELDLVAASPLCTTNRSFVGRERSERTLGRCRVEWIGLILITGLALSSASASASDSGSGDRRAVVPREAAEILRGDRSALDPDPVITMRTLQSLAGAISGDSLMATLGDLTSYPTRYTPTSHYAAAASHMRDRFEEFGLDEAYLHDFSCCGGTRQNVVGIKVGTVHPEEIVILGAHLDATSESPQTLAPGAEDNGTGSAAVTELARLLAPIETERTIHFVLFGGEEQGLFGSSAYASMAASEGWNVPAVLTFDMVGYDDPAGAQLWVEGFVSGTNSQWLVQLVRQHAETYADLSVYVYPNDGFGSDHVPFHTRGFPSMLAIENEWDSYPCYHRTCDTIDWVSESLLRGITIANGTTALDLAGPLFTPAILRGHVDLLDSQDESGVSLTLPGTGYQGDISDPDGSYRLANLLPGTYTLLAECPGYYPQEVEISLASEEQAVLDLVMIPVTSGVGSGPAPADGPLGGGSISPNPFRDQASISFRLAGPASIGARVYDAEGRLRRTLAVRSALSAGDQTLTWNGRDDSDREVPTGVYFVELRLDGSSSATESIRLPILHLR